MRARTVKVPPAVRDLIRRLHPQMKRIVRDALQDIIEDPSCGKPLERELKGYWSLGIGRYRLVYRPDEQGAEIVAIGPRSIIYRETKRKIDLSGEGAE